MAVHPRQTGRNRYSTQPDHFRAVRDNRPPDCGDITELFRRIAGLTE